MLPSGPDLLACLTRPHPRLFLTADRWPILREQVRTDPVSRRLFQYFLLKCGQYLEAKPVTYEKEGIRLLGISRTCLERVLALSLVAKLTEESRYVRRAWQEMRAVITFPDWNPRHFLDVAEMTLALAVGYDWLYDQLETKERQSIETAILEKGVKPSFESPADYLWWRQGDNNWNQVCHAGITAGALAIAEHHPELAAKTVARAIAGVPFAAKSYAPDGAYAEGPGYWQYGTQFHVVLIEVLNSVFEKDFGLSAFPGFRESALYVLEMTAPSGQFFNYADCQIQRGVIPALYWFANHLDQSQFVQPAVALLEKALCEDEPADSQPDNYRLLPLALLWWKPEFAEAMAGTNELPRHWMAHGINPVAVHRSAWQDREAVFVAIKGGTPSSSHGHMDVGSFVLEADGIRWAVDLGMEDYHRLESASVGLWNSSQDGERWKIFRLGHHSHNLLSFDDAPQLVNGQGSIVQFQSFGELPHTILDLSPLYLPAARSVHRGVALLPDRRALFQDEWIIGEDAVSVRWQMLTCAQVSVFGHRITLSQEGKTLDLQVSGSEALSISIQDVSIPPMPYDSENPDTRIVSVTCHSKAAAKGYFRVFATPQSALSFSDVGHRSLDDWRRTARSIQ